jgi:hypothetical protein
MTLSIAERVQALNAAADIELAKPPFSVADPSHRQEIAEALVRARPDLIAQALEETMSLIVAAALDELKSTSPDWFDVELDPRDHAILMMRSLGLVDWRSQLSMAVTASAERRRAEARQAKSRMRSEGREADIPVPANEGKPFSFGYCDTANRFRNMEPRR